MKHSISVTTVLILLFFTSQIVGLFLLQQSIDEITVAEDGTVSVGYEEPITGRPQLEEEDSFIYTLAMILGGTLILLGLIKFKLFQVWKAWFFFAIFGALFIALDVILDVYVALFIALMLTVFKLYKPNIIVHNAAEVLMYAGIAILLSPMFSVFWVIMLLLAISVYDAFAVWKSKHMVVMAKAMSDQNMFAGLYIPYGKKMEIKDNKLKPPSYNTQLPRKHNKPHSAILGGGDIAFPLIFAGSVMTKIIQVEVSKNLKMGLSIEMANLLASQTAFWQSLLVSLGAGVALSGLLFFSKKGKFYPAMPFITAGSLLGYAVTILLAL